MTQSSQLVQDRQPHKQPHDPPPPQPEQSQKKARRRNRVPISCVICRRRKVKCDKQKPQCSNCIKNNVQHLCHYLEPKWAKPLESETLSMNVDNANGFANPAIAAAAAAAGVTSSDGNAGLVKRDMHNNAVQNTANNVLMVKIEDQQALLSTLNESVELKKELEALKNKMKFLETENTDLKKKIVLNTAGIPTANPVLRPLKNQDSEDLLDCIFNSNILFIAQKGSQYNLPITYQISVFSWMFMVKNDLYLNDLWMKILKLRQHYEYYYNSKGASEKNMISHYRNYDHKLSKFKSNDPSSLKTSEISKEKTSEHTSKLKKFLEKSLNLENNGVKSGKVINNNKVDETSFSANSEATENYPHLPNVCPVTGVLGVCPIGNSNAVMNHEEKAKPNTEIDTNLPDSKLQSEKRASAHPRKQQSLKRKNHPTLKFNKCPVLHPNEASLSSPISLTPGYPKKLTSSIASSTSINSSAGAPSATYNDAYSDSDEPLEDPKVCPLMVSDAKALFKEKLSKMNISAIRESYNVHKKKAGSASPAKSRGTPVIPSGPSTPMSEIKPEDTEKLSNFVPIAMKPEPQTSSRQNSMKRQAPFPDTPQPNKSKKLKTISPSAIKSLNYNNTKQIISVIEQYLPSKKVVGLLLDRFFDRLYIYMPYVDETSFKLRVATILKTTDAGCQKIRLSSIGTQYCEEFLTLCLMLIIIRLSWLSLPEKSVTGLSQSELLLMKPENFVSFVLVDMVKEIFSNTKILSKPSMIIFQVGLYLKIYSTVSPEDGFDTDDSYTRNTQYSTTSNQGQSFDPNSSTNLAAQQADAGTPSTPSSSSNSNDLSGDLTNESPNLNSPNFISMLVQLARTIGLNRDPLNFRNFYPTATDDEITISRLFKKRHLWRKLWYGLMFTTIEANLSLGDYKKGLPIEIDLDPTLGSAINHSWDCRLPGGIEQGVLEKSFENGKVLQRELCIVQNFRESIVSYRWIFRGMKLLFAVDKPPTTLEVENVVTALSEIICEKSKYGFGIDLIMGDQEIVNPFRARNSSVWVKKYTKQIKVLRLKVHLIVKNMIFTLNYLMFLNHEQKLSKLLGQKHALIEKIDKQRTYIEKFFEASLLSAIENFKLFVQFMDDSNKVFPNCSTELLIYPFLMILNHRSHEFLISLVLRVQQNSPVIMEILKKNRIEPKELQKRLFTYLETFIERLDVLTKNYYYAWVLKRLVKFFYNILLNSQKFFKLNFKRMNISQNTSKKNTSTLSDLNSNNEVNMNKASGNSGEKSAFEIAFGTSKLPPVTDFTHDDRREINFNSVISNSDLLLNNESPGLGINVSPGNNMAMNAILSNSNESTNIMIHNNTNNSNINSNINGSNNIHNNNMANIAMTQISTPDNIHLEGNVPDNSNFSVQNNHTVDNLAGNLLGNMANDMNFNSTNGVINPVMNPHELNGIGNNFNPNMVGSGAKQGMTRWNNGLGEDLNELFDDQFLNDIGGFAMENVAPTGVFGLRRGLSHDAILSPSVAVPNVNGMGEMENSTMPLVEGMLVNHPNNDMMNINSFSGGKGEIYNSLNEIDFTNVDLNAPVDSMPYGFELNIQEEMTGLNPGANNPLKNGSNGFRRSNGHDAHGSRSNSADDQSGGFGHWNFF